MSKIDGKKVSLKNHLHEFAEYDLDNIVFADINESSVPDSNPPVKFHRINILTKNAKMKESEDGHMVPERDENGKVVTDGTLGSLIVGFDSMFSFGVSVSTDPNTKKVTGHSMSFCLYTKDGVTEKEIKIVDKLEALVLRCKEYLLTAKKSFKRPLLEMSDLKDMNKFVYWKVDEDGERVAGVGPTFSAKLIEFKERVDDKGNVQPYQMNTVFYLEDEVDDEGNPREVDPLSFLSDNANKKYNLCYVRPAIKIDSIFIGGKIINIQCKIVEADIKPIQGSSQRFLHRHQTPKDKISILTGGSKNVNPLLAISSSSSSSSSSVKEELSEDNESELENKNNDELHDEPPVAKKKVVKKIVKKSE